MVSKLALVCLPLVFAVCQANYYPAGLAKQSASANAKGSWHKAGSDQIDYARDVEYGNEITNGWSKKNNAIKGLEKSSHDEKNIKSPKGGQAYISRKNDYKVNIDNSNSADGYTTKKNHAKYDHSGKKAVAHEVEVDGEVASASAAEYPVYGDACYGDGYGYGAPVYAPVYGKGLLGYGGYGGPYWGKGVYGGPYGYGKGVYGVPYYGKGGYVDDCY